MDRPHRLGARRAGRGAPPDRAVRDPGALAGVGRVRLGVHAPRGLDVVRRRRGGHRVPRGYLPRPPAPRRSTGRGDHRGGARRLRRPAHGGRGGRRLLEPLRGADHRPHALDRRSVCGPRAWAPASERRQDQGLNNLRQWLAWRPASPDAAERVPRLRIIRTPANLRVFDRLREVLLDPDRPGDARKADADPETGEGGDDEYDCLRYGLAGRPVPAPLAPLAPALGAWSPEVLAWEADRTRRGLPLEPAPTHPVLTRNPARPW